MSTTKGTPRALASLKLPRRNTQLVTYAQGIVTSMTSNAHFPTPVPPLSSVASVLGQLATAETQALTRVKGAVAARNEKRAALVSLLQQLRSYVQVTADANPENASSIFAVALPIARIYPELVALTKALHVGDRLGLRRAARASPDYSRRRR